MREPEVDDVVHIRAMVKVVDNRDKTLFVSHDIGSFWVDLRSIIHIEPPPSFQVGDRVRFDNGATGTVIYIRSGKPYPIILALDETDVIESSSYEQLTKI